MSDGFLAALTHATARVAAAEGAEGQLRLAQSRCVGGAEMQPEQPFLGRHPFARSLLTPCQAWPTMH
jgi:hypothetical protein